jgi:low affinity Fe/Cu permease
VVAEPEAGMQRLVKRVVGWVILAALVAWVIVLFWAVTGGSAFDFGRVWVWTSVVVLGAVARMTIVARLVDVTDRRADEPTYRI